jgi:hypothetical protein
LASSFSANGVTKLILIGQLSPLSNAVINHGAILT